SSANATTRGRWQRKDETTGGNSSVGGMLPRSDKLLPYSSPVPAHERRFRSAVAPATALVRGSAAAAQTKAVAGRLASSLADLHDANCSVVVTGSLGRAEATEGSDADWVLLIDGPSEPDRRIAVGAARPRGSRGR